MYLIIGAYDEILSEDEEQIVSFIDDNLERHKCPIIMTCRKSHKSELTNFFNSKWKINTHNSWHSLYIPWTKIWNASKISQNLGHEQWSTLTISANLYKQYETVWPIHFRWFLLYASIAMHYIHQTQATHISKNRKGKKRPILLFPCNTLLS